MPTYIVPSPSVDGYPEKDLDNVKLPAAQVLNECIHLMIKKNHDYNNPNSTVKQAQHYRRGMDTIHDMLMQKMFRAQSLLESNNAPKNEALEDTYKDIINYAAFAVLYLRGDMPGQSEDRDIFNREIKEKPSTVTGTFTYGYEDKE